MKLFQGYSYYQNILYILNSSCNSTKQEFRNNYVVRYFKNISGIAVFVKLFRLSYFENNAALPRLYK